MEANEVNRDLLVDKVRTLRALRQRTEKGLMNLEEVSDEEQKARLLLDVIRGQIDAIAVIEQALMAAAEG